MCKWWSVNVEYKVERPAMRGKQGHARPNHERFRKTTLEARGGRIRWGQENHSGGHRNNPGREWGPETRWLPGSVEREETAERGRISTDVDD